MDPDWRFVAAYNAALQSAVMEHHACGFEATKGGGAHHYTIESLRLTIAADANLIDELQMSRAKRGGAIYEMTGIATLTEIKSLCTLASELRDRVMEWLKANNPDFLKAPKRRK